MNGAAGFFPSMLVKPLGAVFPPDIDTLNGIPSVVRLSNELFKRSGNRIASRPRTNTGDLAAAVRGNRGLPIVPASGCSTPLRKSSSDGSLESVPRAASPADKIRKPLPKALPSAPPRPGGAKRRQGKKYDRVAPSPPSAVPSQKNSPTSGGSVPSQTSSGSANRGAPASGRKKQKRPPPRLPSRDKSKLYRGQQQQAPRTEVVAEEGAVLPSWSARSGAVP